jgi:thiol-disulfide isomerase/thioredoxin
MRSFMNTRHSRSIVVLACLLVLGRPGAAAEPATGGVIELTDGGYVPGAVADSERVGVLGWLSPSFVEPFAFELDAVEGIRFARPVGPMRPVGDTCFELAGGDVVFGTRVALDDRSVVLDAPRLGRLHVDRSCVLRIERLRDETRVIYLGPNGLEDWGVSTPKGAWREGSGRLVTTQARATLEGDLGLPARAAVEFEISWLKKPDFVLELGVAADEAAPAAAGVPMPAPAAGFRFEVWGDDLVALRETPDRLALASIAKVSAGPGRVRVRAFIDQLQGRLLVCSPTGAVVADLNPKPKAKLKPEVKLVEAGGGANANANADAAAPRANGGVALTNIRGDIRLERLRIGHWDGQAPSPALADRPCIVRTDGSIVQGSVARFDAAARAFVVTNREGEGEGETSVGEDKVASVRLSTVDDDAVRGIRAVTQEGDRLSGELLEIAGGMLLLSIHGFHEFPRVPVGRLRSLAVLRHSQTPRPNGEKDAVLELEGVRLMGRVADEGGQSDATRSCLAWQPRGSITASHLRPGAAGKIVLREPAPRPPATPASPVAARNQALALAQAQAQARIQAQRQAVRVIVQQPNGGLIVTTQPQEARVAAAAPAKPSLQLRSGDVIPAEVTKIDGDGVWFRSPSAKSTFVAHDKVQAVDLAAESYDAFKVGKSKRERLLTLPRMQKDSPPTHLIRSRDGDYLRGRVVALNDSVLQVEVRLETKDVPRDRIARIIWLHSEKTATPTATGSKEPNPPKAIEPEPRLRVQALRSDGDRLTFVAEHLTESILSGPSADLGRCHVALADVDQILIGGAIEQAAQLAFRRWKLQDALEPRAFQADDPAGRAAGTEAAMVGKPAPDFVLDMLGGAKFRLAERRGQIVLLDFWATWCGPCIQAMPQVERVAQEFRDRGVELVAVNLQEPPDRITAMLQRHNLHPTVALDRDGKVAEQYGASAIPQTVIIDRGGIVARLFVGGGPHLGDQLREAIGAVLADEEKDQDKDKDTNPAAP